MNLLSLKLAGTSVITFYGFENLTVPAGTYNVFKVGIKSDNVNTPILFREMALKQMSLKTLTSRFTLNMGHYDRLSMIRKVRFLSRHQLRTNHF